MAPEFGKPIHHLPLIPAIVLKKHRVDEPLDTRFGSAARSRSNIPKEVRPLLTRTQRIPFPSTTGRDGYERPLQAALCHRAQRQRRSERHAYGVGLRPQRL
jgi:hypothetical protein